MGSFFIFLFKIITRQMPFQVLCLNQLKMLGSFAQNACSEGEVVSN